MQILKLRRCCQHGRKSDGRCFDHWVCHANVNGKSDGHSPSGTSFMR